MSKTNNSSGGICKNCGRKGGGPEELFPVFLEGQTKIGKCEYWCKECLRKRR